MQELHSLLIYFMRFLVQEGGNLNFKMENFLE